MKVKRLPLDTVYGLKERGIDITNQLLVMECTKHGAFPRGTILVLSTDDSSWCPIFREVYGDREGYVNMDRLSVYNPNSKRHVKWRVLSRLQGG